MNEAVYKQPLILFLGAGASKPLGLKTTAEFWEWFHFDSGFDFDLLNAIGESIQPSEEIGIKPDIEAVLDVLEKINDGKELESKIVNRLPIKFTKHRPVVEFQQPVSSGSKITEFIEGLPVSFEISEKVKDLVIKHYSEIEKEKAFELYRSLLVLALSLHQPLLIFTTNYDLAWEKTYEAARTRRSEVQGALFNLVDGFSRELVVPVWSSSAYEHYRPAEEDIILFKLHGSVDWVRTPAGVIQRIESQQRDPGNMQTIIAYPSRLKREIHEEPFRTNYDYLLACLLHAKVCAVIGFSFRDQEIVEEFRLAAQLNKDLELILIDPNVARIERQLEEKLGFYPNCFISDVGELTQQTAARLTEIIQDRVKKHECP